MRITVIILIALVAASRPAAAQSDLPLRDYVHTVWTQHDGIPLGRILRILQTTDGYLWIEVAGEGLLRFDGMRFVRVSTPCAARLQRMESSPDGGLLVACGDRLIRRAARDQFVEMPHPWASTAGVAPRPDLRFFLDRLGRPWYFGEPIRYLGTNGSGGGEFARPTAEEIIAAVQDDEGAWWVSDRNQVARIDEGRTTEVMEVEDVRCLAAARGGGVFAATDRTIWHLRAQSPPSAVIAATPPVVFAVGDACMRETNDGGLWIGTRQHGIALMRNGRLETLSEDARIDGLVRNLLVDREGSIWASSTSGLFRKPMVQVTRSGLTPSFVFADSADSVWTSPADRRDRGLSSITATGARRFVGMRRRDFVAIGQDATGRVWLSDRDDIGYLADGRFMPVRDAANSSVVGVFSFKQDELGQLWAIAERVGVYRVSPGPLRLVVASRDADIRFHVSARFGVWVGLEGGGVEQHIDGRTNVFSGPSPTSGDNRVQTIVEDGDAIWLGTFSGLRRWRNGQWTDWTAQHGLPVAGVVDEIATDRFGRFWMMTRGGILILPRAQFDATPDGGPRPLSFARIGVLDGFVPHSGNMKPSPRVTTDSRGRLFFTTIDSLVRVDPSEVTPSSLAPPIVIESVTIDNRVVDHTMPQAFVEPSRLQFDYTSLSLRSPENARFRYQLAGYDPDWIEAGGERHVTYGTLGPGSYRFRVTGAGSEGVWSEAGASFAFQITPVFWRTWWFRLTMLGFGALIISGLYQLRLRQLTRQFQLGLEARVSERTRIARDLHDTLLQTFQGVLIHFHAATNLLPGRPEEAKRKFDGLLDLAAEAITEGRDAVQGLRAPAGTSDDLAQSISVLGEELAKAHTETDPAAVLVNVEGRPQRLHPILRDDVYRIASEAVRNAMRHAEARNIQVDIQYGRRELRVAIRDDGKGIDATVLENRMAPGHWGLPGMRERAELIGGTLAVMSQSGAGTEIALSIPAVKAYAP